MLKRTRTKRDGYLYLEWHAIDFGNAQDRGQYDDHGARLAAEPHDHLFWQSMRRSAPRGQRADQSEYVDHLRYFSALATKTVTSAISAEPSCADARRTSSRKFTRRCKRDRKSATSKYATVSTARKCTKIFSNLFESRGISHRQHQRPYARFFHGTGHGLGLDIHEPPRIAPVDAILRTGHVVTVEPGLYYLGVGGVRLEDVVVVTAKGNRNLTDCPQFLEI